MFVHETCTPFSSLHLQVARKTSSELELECLTLKLVLARKETSMQTSWVTGTGSITYS